LDFGIDLAPCAVEEQELARLGCVEKATAATLDDAPDGSLIEPKARGVCKRLIAWLDALSGKELRADAVS
jgi:hypothetical protein